MACKLPPWWLVTIVKENAVGRFAASVSAALSRVAGLVLLASLWGIGASANAAGYAFVLLPPLPGSTESTGLGLNDRGQVVGWSGAGEAAPLRATRWDGATAVALLGLDHRDNSTALDISNAGQVVGSSGSRATLWNSGVPTDLGTLGGSYSTAVAISRAGQVVGYSTLPGDDANYNHATLWNGLIAIDLGTLGGTFSSASGINSAGQVVGTSYLAGNLGGSHAVLWNGGTATDLGLGSASKINDRSQVVGQSFEDPASNSRRATLWSAGVRIDLGTLGGSLSMATDINNAGQIVGSSLLPGDVISHAVIWLGTVATDLNTFLDAPTREAGWYLSDAAAINARGWITGTAFNALTNERRAYLLRPASHRAE
jgi:probable HAF family extracellular repeat protein